SPLSRAWGAAGDPGGIVRVDLRALGRLAAVILAVSAAVACGRDDAPLLSVTDQASTAATQDFSGKGVAGLDRRAEFSQLVAAPPPPAIPQVGSDSIRPGQMLIRNGFVSVRVDSLEAA